MSEIVVCASFKLRPEHLEEAEAILREVIRTTHAEEGCLLYALHRSTEEPTRYVLVERWRSREDLDGHYKSPHLAPLSLATGVLAEPPVTWVCEPLPEGDIVKGTLAGRAQGPLATGR
jgi:quinol monooxygenase YgiN